MPTNPFIGIEKLVTDKVDRYVTDAELALAVEVGRRMSAPQHIVALALKTPFLCVRRSFEVRKLTRPQIKPEGIEWVAPKRQRGAARKVGIIEWSPALRATIDEALAIERYERCRQLVHISETSAGSGIRRAAGRPRCRSS